ncbi:hypothetical protein FS837_011010 [Tulasnella sp. UAMH 9824]|nr:hypothetical protein FS837_011010 [Tulasnella sp. UAMH 9824]
MTPKTSNASTLKTTTDLSALTHEIAKSVSAGDTGGPSSKRTKHVEKAKVQQLTKQLAMRLQYAKLKVDHGWSRQNLDEVENLYFHHYRDRRPEPSHQYLKAPQRRIGAAPFPSSSTSASTSHVHVEVSAPSGSQTKPGQPTSPSQTTPLSPLRTQPTIVVDGAQGPPGPLPIGYDPSVYSVGLNSASSSVPTQPSSSTSATRTASSPRPVVRTSHHGSRSHPYLLSPNATGSSSASVLASPHKISAKKAGKAPVRGGSSTGGGSKALGKTSSKTSIPSTLQSPQIAESTAAARLAQMMGTKPTAGPAGSTSVAVPAPSSLAGPTSYESFWSQLGSGGLGARTLLSASPSRSTSQSTSAAPPLSATSSGVLKTGVTPTSSFGASTSTSGLLQSHPITSPAPNPTAGDVPASANISATATTTVPYHSLFRALQVTPEQLAASDARLNAATSQAQIGSYNPPAAAFAMSGSKVLNRLPPATQSNPA